MPTWRTARRTAQRLNRRLKASTPGTRRNGSCGTVQCHSPSWMRMGGRSAENTLRIARLTSRPEPLGGRRPGESTYSTGMCRDSRVAM